MSIVEDFGSLKVALQQLEDDKAKQIADAANKPAFGTDTAVSDADRVKFFGMYGWGYQAPATDAA